MSAESFARGNDEVQVPSRLLHYFDLYGIWGMYAILVASTVLVALGMTDGFDTTFWVMVSINVVYMVASFAAARRHQTGLCAHCFDAFPLNPGEYAATRARLALRTVHVVTEGTARIYFALQRLLRHKALAVIVGLATTFGVAWLIGLVLREWFSPLFIAALILYGYAMRKHQQLQLWCPWCDHRRDDGDDDEPEPQPKPTGDIKHTANA